MLIVSFVFEFIRPPGLEALHVPMFIVLLLPSLWFLSSERPWSRNLTLQACFIATGAAMLPFASNYYGVFHGTRVMYGYFATALAITWLLADRRNFRLAAWSWVAIMCLQALWAIAHEGKGHGDFLNDENDLALGCVTALPFSILGFQFLRGWRRWTCAVAAMLFLAAIVVSFSRGGFVGLAAAIAYLVLSGEHRFRKLLAATCAAGMVLLVVPSEYTQEMQTIQETDSGTAETRFFLWAAATRMWMDHPLVGVGPYNSAYKIGQYQPDPTESGLFTDLHFTDRDWSGKALHSLYFELLAERGLVGCVLFAWLAIHHYRTLRRLRRKAKAIAHSRRSLAQETIMFAIALEAAVAGYLAAGAFLSMLTYPYFWMFTAFAAALERRFRRESRS